MHIKEAEYGSILYQCPKGPDKSKKQGDVQSDKKAADLFWHGGTDRSTVIFSDENSNEDQYGSHGNDGHYDAILFLAMYEKNGQPLEVILNHMIQAIFKRPKIRPYKTDNYYAALLRQAEAEKEVEKIVRLSQKEKSGEQEVHNAGRIKQGRPDGSKGNRKKCPEK